MGEYDYGTIENAVTCWKKKESVWTVEMGGLGCGYEQCIQVIIFEICSNLVGKKFTKEEYDKLTRPIITELDKQFGGFSVAQVSVAEHIAFSFLTIGYNETIKKYPNNRRIMVENRWRWIQ